MSAAQEFLDALHDLGVPLFRARVGGQEFTRSSGWQHLTADGNAERLAEPEADAICAVTGGRVAVVDVDPKNGGDVEVVRLGLDECGVKVYAEVATPGGGAHFYVAAFSELRTARLPGIDVQAAGANVFVPGTRRPKYDGAGYRIVSNNLGALADTDDDGIALRGWLDGKRSPDATAAADRLNDPVAPRANPHEGTIPVGQRDTSLYTYACLMVSKGLSAREVRGLVALRWKACDQPAGDPYPLEVALEKADRAWREFHHQAVDSGEAASAPRASIDWVSFMDADDTEPEWLAGQIAEQGEQVAVVGAGKVGKSLFSLEWAEACAGGWSFLDDEERDAVDVLYVDQENTERDLRRRVRALGLDPSRLGRLHYLSFPAYPMLDTVDGRDALLADVERHGAKVVFLDTVSRMIGGSENDSETWLALYRHTLVALKARKVTVVRLDHTGKDLDKGARGSSAKTQDVDRVWELRATSRNRLRLNRTHSRTGLGDEKIDLTRLGASGEEGSTRHVRDALHLEVADPELTTAVKTLDAHGVPPGLGRGALKRQAEELGCDLKFSNEKWSQIVRSRGSRT